MKNPTSIVILITSAVLIITARTPAGNTPLATAFTYQGQLKLSGDNVNSTADFQFTLWDALSGPNQVAGPVNVNNITIANGLFATQIDFGSNVFNGDARWLQVTVRSPAGSGPFTTLSPRQSLAAAPYSLQTRGIFVSDAGQVGIGLTNPSVALHVNGAENNGSTAGLRIDSAAQSMLLDGNEIDTNTAVGLFLNNNNANNVILVNGGGNVGIGTFNPNAKAHVVGNGAETVLRLTNGGTGGTALMAADVSGTGEAASFYGVTSNDLVTMQNDGTGTAAKFVGDVLFTAGDFNIDMTDDDQKIEVTGATAFGPLLRVDNTAGGATFAVYGDCFGTGTGVQGVSDTGEGVIGISTHGIGVLGAASFPDGYDFYASGEGVDFGSDSSIRWKRNIKPIDDPLVKLADLRGVYFDWDAEHGGHHDVGMIAEEVGAVLPEIVNYEVNGFDASGMDYSKLTPLLVEAVKSLRAEKDTQLETLRNEKNAEIASLRAEKDSEISDLRRRLAALEAAVARLASQKEAR